MEGIEGLKAQCYLDVDVWFPPFRSDLPNPHLSHYNQKVRLCEKNGPKRLDIWEISSATGSFPMENKWGRPSSETRGPADRWEELIGSISEEPVFHVGWSCDTTQSKASRNRISKRDRAPLSERKQTDHHVPRTNWNDDAAEHLTSLHRPGPCNYTLR